MNLDDVWDGQPANIIRLHLLADPARLPDGRLQAIRLHDPSRVLGDTLFWVDRETDHLQQLRAYRVGMFSEPGR